MKFVVDYDILRKIDQSKNGDFKLPLISCLCGGAIGMLMNVNSWIESAIQGKNIVPNVIFSVAVVCITSPFVAKSLQMFNIESVKQKADFKLEDLVNQLYKLDVRTNLELLKNSKLNQTKYKIVYSDGDMKLPKLKQFKAIIIPLTNGYEETVLQEHLFGDEDYKISVGKIDKKRKNVFVKRRIVA